jgi:hypothetical protein
VFLNQFSKHGKKVCYIAKGVIIEEIGAGK